MFMAFTQGMRYRFLYSHLYNYFTVNDSSYRKGYRVKE